MIRILILNDLESQVVEHLNSIPEFEISFLNSADRTRIDSEIAACDAIVCGQGARLDAKMVQCAARLKLIVTIDVAAVTEIQPWIDKQHITLQALPVSSAISIAEYTLAAMLLLLRFPKYVQKKHKPAIPAVGVDNELYAKTVGMIGDGDVGQEVARRLAAFGAQLCCYDYHKHDRAATIPHIGLDELLSRSDIVFCYFPTRDREFYPLGAREFDKMKGNAILIDVAGAFNRDDLIVALQANSIKAAAIDETWPGMPVLDNLFATHRRATATVENNKRANDDVFLVLKEFFNV